MFITFQFYTILLATKRVWVERCAGMVSDAPYLWSADLLLHRLTGARGVAVEKDTRGDISRSRRVRDQREPKGE
jgi:hypothetical protein